MKNTSLSLLIYLSLIAATYALLILVAYRRSGDINRVFEDYRRPARLKTTIRFWFAGMIAVFLFVQYLRVPCFVSISRTLSSSSVLVSPFGAVQAAVLILVLISELEVVVHWLLYLANAWTGAARYRVPQPRPLPDPAPAVLVLVPSCDEEPAVLRRSLSTVGRLRYPNYRVCLVENSRKLERKAQAVNLAQRYGIEVLHVPNRGHKAGALNDARRRLQGRFDYLAVVDADQTVKPEFLEHVVPVLEADSDLAFVQTPQLYENAEATWLVRAAAQQEMMLYDTIQEGKSANGRALCCGTNFVIRIRALEDVGGWDEGTLSEDLATSFLLNWKGWRSVYMRRVYAVGLGPLNLPAYWRQQRRWAVGNTAVAGRIVRAMFTRPTTRLPLATAVDYLWSAGFYVTTLALACLATLPMLTVLITRAGAAPSPWEWVFLSVYPLYAAIMLFPYVHMRLRGYPLRNLVMLQGLLAITIPVYFVSVCKALFRRRHVFETAPKSVLAEHLTIWRAPQTIAFAALVITGALLVGTVVRNPALPVMWIALFWAFFYTVSVGHFFIFAVESGRLINQRARRRAGRAGPTSSLSSTASDSPHAATGEVKT